MLERAQGFANGGGMMREIVDHSDPADFAPDLLPAGDSIKTLQRLANVGERHVVKSRGRNRHRRVPHVKLTDERHLEFVFAENKTRSARRVGRLANAPRAV